jgi:hypothetical protein
MWFCAGTWSFVTDRTWVLRISFTRSPAWSCHGNTTDPPGMLRLSSFRRPLRGFLIISLGPVGVCIIASANERPGLSR